MKTYSVTEAKSQLPKLIDRALAAARLADFAVAGRDNLVR
jgi:hypothetical protein